MAFKSYNDSKWIFDSYDVTCEQRAVSDADFADGTTYDGVEWDQYADANTKMITKRKYVSRRQVWDIKLFKKISGTSFTVDDIRKYRTTGVQTPPDGAQPNDTEFYPKGIWMGFGTGWYLVSLSTTFTKDGGVTLTGHWKKYFNWELVLLQTPS